MLYIAFLLLTRNKEKYVSIILGLTFTSFIMTQPLAIFLGNLELSYGLVSDINLPDIWVMHPKMQFLDDQKPISKNALYRVAGVKGVQWAKPLFKGLAQARSEERISETCLIIGLDEATLTGAPARMSEGTVGNLRYADGIIIDEESAHHKFSYFNERSGHKIPLKVGDSLEINNHRAVVVGTAKVTRTFQSYPILYTSYANATKYVPSRGDLLNFVLVKAGPGENLQTLCKNITRLTGLAAYTKEDFKKLTVWYYLKNTGILINFSISILIAFLVGGIITGQIFYTFTMENLRYFGLLKAMGTSKETLAYMILFQALIASLIGYGLGIGVAALVTFLSRNTMIVCAFPLDVFIITIFGILFISFFSAAIIIRKLAPLEPAVIFRN